MLWTLFLVLVLLVVSLNLYLVFRLVVLNREGSRPTALAVGVRVVLAVCLAGLAWVPSLFLSKIAVQLDSDVFDFLHTIVAPTIYIVGIIFAINIFLVLWSAIRKPSASAEMSEAS